MTAKTETINKTNPIDMDDQQKAGTESTDELIKSFINRSIEDGGISVAGLQALAHSLGVDQAELIKDEMELIRRIQNASKHQVCFRTTLASLCDDKACQWRTECKKLVAEWMR